MQSLTQRPQQLCPYIIVRDAKSAIAFYVRTLRATLNYQLIDPGDGKVGHAELSFGSSTLLLADEYPDFGAVSPDSLGGSPVKLHLEVSDAQEFITHAVSEGAVLLRPLKLEFYGHLTALLADPFGYSWFISEKVEDVSAKEMQRRWQEMATPCQ